MSRITRPRLDFAAQNNKELETFNCLAETRAHFYIYVPFLLLFFFFFGHALLNKVQWSLLPSQGRPIYTAESTIIPHDFICPFH